MFLDRPLIKSKCHDYFVVIVSNCFTPSIGFSQHGIDLQYHAIDDSGISSNNPNLTT